MSELNIKFPGILLGYVSNVGYHLSSDECNELTKLWSHNEYNYDKLKTENDWYKEKNLEWQKKYDTDTDQLSAENERLMETIELLQNWVNAYPLDVFPEPDLKLARKLLTDGGVSYDALNAYSMRHVINGVGKIIDEALNEVEK